MTTILAIVLILALAVYGAHHAWKENREAEEFRRLIRKLYGGGE